MNAFLSIGKIIAFRLYYREIMAFFANFPSKYCRALCKKINFEYCLYETGNPQTPSGNPGQ